MSTIPQAPAGLSSWLARDLNLINMLVALKFVDDPKHMLQFTHNNKYFYIATETGLEQPCVLAKGLTAEKISALRTSGQDRKFEKMQRLYDAGFAYCPASGVPVFDAKNMPASLPSFMEKIAMAINDPTAEKLDAAAKACEHVCSDIEGMKAQD